MGVDTKNGFLHQNEITPYYYVVQKQGEEISMLFSSADYDEADQEYEQLLYEIPETTELLMYDEKGFVFRREFGYVV